MNKQETIRLVCGILYRHFPSRSLGVIVEPNHLDVYDHSCSVDAHRVYVEFDPEVTVRPSEMGDVFNPSPYDKNVGWCITVIDPTGVYVVHP